MDPGREDFDDPNLAMSQGERRAQVAEAAPNDRWPRVAGVVILVGLVIPLSVLFLSQYLIGWLFRD